jgi:hypothetical protein
MDLDAEFARFTAELKSVEESVAAAPAGAADAAPPPLAPPPVRPPPQASARCHAFSGPCVADQHDLAQIMLDSRIIHVLVSLPVFAKDSAVSLTHAMPLKPVRGCVVHAGHCKPVSSNCGSSSSHGAPAAHPPASAGAAPATHSAPTSSCTSSGRLPAAAAVRHAADGRPSSARHG